jgi:hypothetical protein
MDAMKLNKEFSKHNTLWFWQNYSQTNEGIPNLELKTTKFCQQKFRYSVLRNIKKMSEFSLDRYIGNQQVKSILKVLKENKNFKLPSYEHEIYFYCLF